MCFLPSSIRVLYSTTLDGHGEVGIVTTLIRDTERWRWERVHASVTAGGNGNAVVQLTIVAQCLSLICLNKEVTACKVVVI